MRTQIMKVSELVAVSSETANDIWLPVVVGSTQVYLKIRKMVVVNTHYVEIETVDGGLHGLLTDNGAVLVVLVPGAE